MTSFCNCKNSRMGVAIVALLVTAGITNTLASATENKPEFDDQVNQAFGLLNSTVVTLDLPDVADRALVVELQINEQGYTLALQPHSVRGKNYVCYISLADGKLLEVDPGPERTFRGTVLEDGGSIIAGSLLENGMKAKIMFSNGDQYWIEPLVGRVAGANPGSHVIYNSNDVIEHGGICGGPNGPGNVGQDVHDDGDPIAGGGPDCITQLAIDADFPYFQRYGTIALTVSQAEAVINSMNVQYEIEVDITHVISAFVIRTSAVTDPYTTNDSFDLVCQLGNWWDTNMGFVARDTVQLFTGRNIDGGTIGRAATFGGICDSTSCGFFPCDDCGDFVGEASGHYSFVQSDFNGNFGCATDLSAHELGHLWNAQHCNCPGCTMQSGIQCANTFCGAGIQATIIAFRNSIFCLDCTGQASFCGDSNAGNCFTENASPYCDDTDCCDLVCAADPFCCNSRWDGLCSARALTECGNCGNPDAGGCLDGFNGTPGCSDADCCAIICMFDAYCCDNFWDGQCANEAADFCTLVGASNDDCEDAISIAVPSFTQGFTNFATVDSGLPVCDGVTVTAPGVWYSVFGTGTTMTASTCSEFTEYNTKISVFCNGCVDPICVAANDDDCAGIGVHSTVSWCSEDGREYLILVHGSGNATGGFDLSVSADAVACGLPDGCFDAGEPCFCPADALQEGEEPCGSDNNGGCNSDPPVFVDASCGDTFCGSAWADGGTRDTDWYIVTVNDPDGDGFAIINARLTSEFDGVCFIVDGIAACAPVIVGVTGSSINCDNTAVASAMVTAPGTYVVFVANANFDGNPCGAGNSYTLEITCEGRGNPACDKDAGDCCVAGGNGTPGCEDIDCCEIVCAIDPFCCDISWDSLCADEAVEFCKICPPPPGELIWFTSQAEFEAFNQGEGKVIKGIEDFEESTLDVGLFDIFDDSLVSGAANLPDGFPFPVGMTGLPNLIVQSNLDHTLFTPNPRGIDGLIAVASGNSGAVSDVVISNFPGDSYDLIFTGEKTGVGFSLISFFGADAVEINVFSTSNVHLGEMASTADPTGNSFIGVWSAIPIGRINIFDVGGGAEGADRIQAWGEADPCPWDLDGSGAVGTNDLLLLFAQWGQVGTSADFDGGGVGTSDLLILFANWGPCPSGAECANPGNCKIGFPDCGDPGCGCATLFDGSGICINNFPCEGLEPCPDGNCPPGQFCLVLTCCGDSFCFPEEALCGTGGIAPPPPGTRTAFGVVGQN